MQTGFGGREKIIESWVSVGWWKGKRENVEAQIRSKYFIGNSRITNKNITFLEEWDLARDKRALLPVGKPRVAPVLKGSAGNPSIYDRVRPSLSMKMLEDKAGEAAAEGVPAVHHLKYLPY